MRERAASAGGELIAWSLPGGDFQVQATHMPEVDGVTATRLIARDRQLAATRVVMLTTFDDDETVFAVLRTGGSGFLVKDVEPEGLLKPSAPSPAAMRCSPPA